MDFQQRITTAEISLRGSTDPEQKALARDDLRRVAEEARGRAESRRALELLDQYPDAEPQSSRDRELAEYERRWAALQGLTDARLFELLAELKEKPHLATRLLLAVIRSLRAWIAGAVVGLDEFNGEEVAALNRFVDVISRIHIYRGELGDLRELRNGLFRLRYVEVSRRIDDALRAWDDAEAWRQLELLEDPPAGFAEEVGALQAAIYGVGKVKQTVAALIEQSPKGETDGWTEVGGLVGYAQEAHAALVEHDIPEPWKGQLQLRMAAALGAAAQFLEKKAAGANTFKDVRAFWAEYRNLPLTEAHARLGPQESWFQNFVKHLDERVSREVEKAPSPQTLDQVGARLREDKANLPDHVRAAVESLLNHVVRVSAAWAAMRAGDQFDRPAPAAGLPMPSAFDQDAAHFGARRDRVGSAFAALEAADGGASEQTYHEALAVAQSVLEGQPGHLLAARLRDEAEQRLVNLRVEAALAGWDFERLIELCAGRTGKWAFSYYVENESDLRQWLEPHVKRERFASWESAQIWWDNWKTAKAQIPRQPPPALLNAMRREEEKRRDEWAAVLMDLIERDLSPEECASVAASLKDGPEDLQQLDKTFTRKAEAGRALRFIRARNWDAAQQIIDSLDESQADTRRLKIRLEVERAGQQGVEVLADVLKREWGAVKNYIDDAHALLLKAIGQAWRERREEAVAGLREVAGRVLAVERGPQAQPLRKWVEWFAVEQAVKSAESTTSLKQLVAYQKEHGQPEDEFRERLARLIDYWQDSNNLVMLAWADQMFRWPLATDPQELLRRESEEEAKGVLSTLEADEDLQPDRLRQMQQELGAKEAAWRRLDEYLVALVPRTGARAAPPKDLERASATLRHLTGAVSTLDELFEVDLRREANKERLDAVRAVLVRHLPGVAMRQKLAKQAERLEPLANLYAIEKRIRDEALHCRSESDVDVYEPDAFGRLANRVREMVERFRRADLVNRAMWRVVSAEYCDSVYRDACVNAEPPPLSDLARLATKLDELAARERDFRDKMERVWEAKPSLGAGSAFNPDEHADFLRGFPTTRPVSRRDYLFFKYRYAEVEPLKSIIAQSRDKLPSWIRTYLDEGIPSCADET